MDWTIEPVNNAVSQDGVCLIVICLTNGCWAHCADYCPAYGCYENFCNVGKML